VLAAFVVEHRWPGGIMVVMPSDHRVRDKRGFRRTIRLAAERAEKGGLVTIGIPPAYPATVYGYLHLDSVFTAGGEAVPLRGFVEKPIRERAEEFLASGRFMWNSGIFVWKSSAILEACQRHLPDVYEILSEVKGARSLKKFGSAVARVFPRVKPISIDYGVMEKADNVWAVPASFDWNDIGGWNAAMDLIPEGRDGNRTRGNVVADGGRGNFLISTEDERPLLCAGLSDCIVVSTKHGVLVCRKDQAEQLKPLVERLRSQESTGKKRGGK
jgi:mannose-1-phosphate guanylyltransferase